MRLLHAIVFGCYIVSEKQIHHVHVMDVDNQKALALEQLKHSGNECLYECFKWYEADIATPLPAKNHIADTVHKFVATRDVIGFALQNIANDKISDMFDHGGFWQFVLTDNVTHAQKAIYQQFEIFKLSLAPTFVPRLSISSCFVAISQQYPTLRARMEFFHHYLDTTLHNNFGLRLGSDWWTKLSARETLLYMVTKWKPKIHKEFPQHIRAAAEEIIFWWKIGKLWFGMPEMILHKIIAYIDVYPCPSCARVLRSKHIEPSRDSNYATTLVTKYRQGAIGIPFTIFQVEASYFARCIRIPSDDIYMELEWLCSKGLLKKVAYGEYLWANT